MSNTAYQALQNRFATMKQLGDAMAILHWDFATMMPNGGADSRAKQIATLQTTIHSIITSNALEDLLSQAEESSDGLSPIDQRNLALMRHKWRHANAISAELIERQTLLGSQCEMIWRDARDNNAFSKYAQSQQDVLNITREIAQAKAESFGCSLYDALLDSYDPGRSSAQIDTIFAELETFLPSFLENVLEHQKQLPDFTVPQGPFSQSSQHALALTMMEKLGFDFQQGRVDTSHHPFCGGTNHDVRITTSYKEHDFTFALMGILHETGHALYEQGLPKDYDGQPIGESLGMTIHESQSLLIEMQVCRSHAFLHFAAPIIKEHLAHDTILAHDDSWSLSNLTRLYHHVKPGAIRIEADEVTYPLHIILRYNLEKQLINGDLDIKDVPDIWNQYMHDKLGVTVDSYKNGCMQDIHWTDGSFGYFPTYTLGALTAAQIYDSAKQDPDIEYGIKRGDFSPLVSWLRTNIHSKGATLTPDELTQQATGQPLSCDVYIAHLKNRYLA